MKKNFISFCALVLSLNLAAQTDQGTFYISLGNAYKPISIISNEDLFDNEADLQSPANNNGMSIGNEWITGFTIDGKQADEDGQVYWDNSQKMNHSNFNIGSQFGYFVSDGLLTGLGVEYGSFTAKETLKSDYDLDDIDDEIKNTMKIKSIAFSPFVKYYIPLNNNALFFSTSYTFGNLKGEQERNYNYSSDQDRITLDESKPIKTSRLQFGTGISLFIVDNIALEPSLNFALNSYKQEFEAYIGDTGPPDYLDITEIRELKATSNAFYFKIAASIYF